MARILIMEDDPNLQHLYKTALIQNGFQVDVAADGQEGLKLFFLNHYDLLLLDVMMPVVNGLECLHTIKDNKSASSSCPIIVLTSLTKDSLIQEVKRLGAVACADKNDLLPHQLVKLVNTNLQSRSKKTS